MTVHFSIPNPAKSLAPSRQCQPRRRWRWLVFAVWLWLSTSAAWAQYRIDRWTTNEGLPDNYVIALLPAKDGKLWIGTRGGLGVLENGSLRAFTEKDGLGSNYIRSLYEDADGVVWIGSYNGGMTRLKDGRLTRHSTNDGLYSNGVFCILEDSQGWFWMNSNPTVPTGKCKPNAGARRARSHCGAITVERGRPRSQSGVRMSSDGTRGTAPT